MGDTEENKGTSDNNPPSGDGSGKIGKIHANWIIFLLVLIGCAVLPICIIAGIWIVQKIGGWVIGWECLGIDDPSNNIYFTDFLGGALGFMVGFILDKFVIERINNVLHYKALMRVVMQELNDIQDAVEEFEKNLKNGVKTDIKEYILDDVVMTAETMSVIANIPFATKQVMQFTNTLSNIQKYIEFYRGRVRKIDEFVTTYIRYKFSEEKIKDIMSELIAKNVSNNTINEIMAIMEKSPDGKFSEEEITKWLDVKFSEEEINCIKKVICVIFELRKLEQAQTNKDNSIKQAIHICCKDILEAYKYSKEIGEYIKKAKQMV